MTSRWHGCWHSNCSTCCSAPTLRHAATARLPLISDAMKMLQCQTSVAGTQQVGRVAAPVLTLRDNAHAQGPADAPSLLDSLCWRMPDLHTRRLLLMGSLLLGQADQVAMLGCRRSAPKG